MLDPFEVVDCDWGFGLLNRLCKYDLNFPKLRTPS